MLSALAFLSQSLPLSPSSLLTDASPFFIIILYDNSKNYHYVAFNGTGVILRQDSVSPVLYIVTEGRHNQCFGTAVACYLVCC